MSDRMQAAAAVVVALIAAALIVVASSPSTNTQTVTKQVSVPVPVREVAGCPEAIEGRGVMGECSPPAGPSLRSFRPGPITYPDRSNKDPVDTAGMRAVARHGHPAIVLKANQGTRFVDSTFVGMAKAAKALHLCVGGYDFDETYTVAEVNVFIARLHAAGIYRDTPCTFPPTLDVEYGSFNQAGLQRQVAKLKQAFGRVKVYTGNWYIASRMSCKALAGLARQLTFWLSGYPIAPVPCGVTRGSYVEHQFTDQGNDGAGSTDMTTFLGSKAQFNAFVHKTVKLTKAQIRSALAKAKAERAELHRDIDSHRCRKGQHNLPRQPKRSRLKYHTLCGRWIKLGLARIATIHSLEKQLR